MRAPCLLFLISLITAVAITPVADALPIQDGNAAINGTSTWEVDNQQSSLVCAVSHYGLSYIYGRFNTCAGSVELNFQEPEQSNFSFTIDPDSIDTNDASRDITLRGESCLDARQYSSITFESVQVASKDQNIGGKTKRTFQVTGNLSIHGETRRVTIPIELLAIGNGPDKQIRCGFMSRFVVSRSEFGLGANVDSVGNSVAVTFCFQTVRKEAAEEEINTGGNSGSDLRFGEPVKPTEVDPKPSEEEESLEDLFGPTGRTAPGIEDLRDGVGPS